MLALTLTACGGDDTISIGGFDATPSGDAAMDASATDATISRDGATSDDGDAAHEAADTDSSDVTTSEDGTAHDASNDDGGDASEEASTDAGTGDSADGSDDGPADALAPVDAGDASDGAVTCSDAGILDVSFGAGGIFSSTLPTTLDGAYTAGIDSIVVQPSGKIVVSGYRLFSSNDNVDPFVMRVLADGSGIDTSFASGGVLSLPTFADTSTTAARLVQQSDGKLLVAASCPASDPTRGTDACVYRFSADGVTDATYGSSGVARVSTAADEIDGAEFLALDAQGRALVGGYAFATGSVTPRNDFIVRLTSAGIVDTTFNGGKAFDAGGFVVSDLQFAGVGALSTGRIVYAPGNAVGFLTETGAPDGTINPGADGGASSFVPLPPGFHVEALFVAPDDSTYVLGSQVLDASEASSIVRLTRAGTLDTIFGNGGQVTYAPSFGMGFFGAAQLGASVYTAGGYLVSKIGMDGAPVTAWGCGGSVQPALPGAFGPSQIAASAGGPLFGTGGQAVLIARLLP